MTMSMADRTRRANAVRRAKRYCARGHLLEGSNLRILPSGSRTCRACLRFTTRERSRKSLECAECEAWFRDEEAFERHSLAGVCRSPEEMRAAGMASRMTGGGKVIWRVRRCRRCGRKPLPDQGYCQTHFSARQRRLRRKAIGMPQSGTRHIRCAWCCSLFEARRSDARYCSHSCRARARRAREATSAQSAS